jgi:tetratricopeptide (TPR) repeat protein
MLHSLPLSLRSALCLLGLALLAARAPGQQTAPVRDYSLSDATGEILPKYKEAVEAKNYPTALAILETQMTKVPADSYDAALLYQIKVQTLLQKGDYSQAIEPLEKGIALSDSKTPTYYEERITREFLFFLAQLYLQEAAASKNAAVTATLYEKADNTMARWLKVNPKSNADAQLIYAQLLYGRAVQVPDHTDLAIIKRALEQVEIGMRLSTHPKDTFYLLKLVCLQQLDRNAEAVEVLELMVKLKPESSNYWQQLAALYLGTGQDLRAILSIERAQARGLMTTPKDHFNLIGIYFNLGQYQKAAELLQTALKKGEIENDVKNWELLALAYNQLEQPYKAIDALKEATKVFPNSGQMEFMIAQAYHGLDKPAEALPHLQAAVAKGNLLKPHSVNLFLAYVAYELKKYDIALAAAQKAAEYPEGVKDARNMIKAIEEMVKDREAKKSKM